MRCWDILVELRSFFYWSNAGAKFFILLVPGKQLSLELGKCNTPISSARFNFASNGNLLTPDGQGSDLIAGRLGMPITESILKCLDQEEVLLHQNTRVLYMKRVCQAFYIEYLGSTPRQWAHIRSHSARGHLIAFSDCRASHSTWERYNRVMLKWLYIFKHISKSDSEKREHAALALLRGGWYGTSVRHMHAWTSYVGYVGNLTMLKLRTVSTVSVLAESFIVRKTSIMICSVIFIETY